MVDFDAWFEKLTRNKPFPWQGRLFERFVTGDFPESCAIPTGLGKTAVIPIWLIALSLAPDKVPRRLTYVVNRRTVVDQATREAENIREKLATVPALESRLKDLAATQDKTLAISTLRGQFADNADWRQDPSRPAIIVGTVDLIGSRLLFSGYGAGFKTKPLHAGFLGQDNLLVHDEAHLEPAFQHLLESIVTIQGQAKEGKALRVMALTATPRTTSEPFVLSEKDHENQVIKDRIRAAKALYFHPVADPKKAWEKIADLALGYKDSGQAILVFVQRVDDVKNIADKLRAPFKGENRVATLTGTMRGLERDELAEKNPVFARYLPPKPDSEAAIPTEIKPEATTATGTVYLVCTSAGEVGVNFSADHLVCDLTTLDSMAQRLGRVNRFGNGNARIDLVHPESFAKDPPENRWENTLARLRNLPGGQGADQQGLNACPAELTLLIREPAAMAEAFVQPPWIVPLSPEILDGWTLTTHREPHPMRPPVAVWLHGLRPLDQPETHVLWRREVDLLAKNGFSGKILSEILDDYPAKPHETLRDTTARITRELRTLAKTYGDTIVWVQDLEGTVTADTLTEILDPKNDLLKYATLFLPPSLGGLENGHFSAKAGQQNDARYDIADEWFDPNGQRRRIRLMNAENPPPGMIRVREFNLANQETDGAAEEDQEEKAKPMIWQWFQATNLGDSGSGSWASTSEQTLENHLDLAEKWARRLANALKLKPVLATALEFAAKNHDLGKRRGLWQKAMGNREYPQKVLAKTAHGLPPDQMSCYRHELGSLIELDKQPDGDSDLLPEMQDLALHMVAAHHGRGRPWFPEYEIYDPENSDQIARETALRVAGRYSRMQQIHGRWGLAYLESLLRATDILASQPELEVQQ